MKINKALLTFIKIGITIVFVLLVCYAAIRLSGVGFDFGYRIFTEEAVEEAPGTDILVQVKEGMSARQIGQMLEEKGLVNDGNLFFLQYRLSAYYGQIQPGMYTLNTSEDAKEMIIIMAGVDDTETEEATESAEGTESSATETEMEEPQEAEE